MINNTQKILFLIAIISAIVLLVASKRMGLFSIENAAERKYSKEQERTRQWLLEDFTLIQDRANAWARVQNNQGHALPFAPDEALNSTFWDGVAKRSNWENRNEWLINLIDGAIEKNETFNQTLDDALEYMEQSTMGYNF